MKKIPTMFERSTIDRAHVTARIAEGCEWVAAGEGVATRKYDGTCVMYDGERWWARREVKLGKAAPEGYVLVEHDEITGKRVGWEPAEQSPFYRYLAEAVALQKPSTTEAATYELLGPRINGNPEGYADHRLVAHELADVLEIHDRSYDAIAAYLYNVPYEGIVFHHRDGRMAKIKRRDFPL